MFDQTQLAQGLQRWGGEHYPRRFADEPNRMAHWQQTHSPNGGRLAGPGGNIGGGPPTPGPIPQPGPPPAPDPHGLMPPPMPYQGAGDPHGAPAFNPGSMTMGMGHPGQVGTLGFGMQPPPRSMFNSPLQTLGGQNGRV